MGVSAAIVGTVVSIAGTATAIAGQEQQLAGQEQAATANAAQAARNARLIRRQASKEAKKTLKRGETAKSTQTALFGKSGVALTGSALDVLRETERLTIEDAEAIIEAGEIGSQEELFRQTQFARERAAARGARRIVPLATLLSGAGSAARTLAPAFASPGTA